MDYSFHFIVIVVQCVFALPPTRDAVKQEALSRSVADTADAPPHQVRPHAAIVLVSHHLVPIGLVSPAAFVAATASRNASLKLSFVSFPEQPNRR